MVALLSHWYVNRELLENDFSVFGRTVCVLCSFFVLDLFMFENIL